jgi:outer membrane protein TolC
MGFLAAFSVQAAESPPKLSLSLNEAIALALRNNINVKSAYLERVLQKFDLYLAHDEYKPQYSTQLGVSYQSYDSLQARFSQLAMSSSVGVSLKLADGGTLSASWNSTRIGDDDDANTRAQDYSGSLNLSFTQPLLKGAGRTVAQYGLRASERAEKANLLMLKETLTSIVNQVINTYQSLQEAESSLEITRRSFERAQALVAKNEVLIEAGRMAPFEIISAKADLARQELSVKTSENSLDSARLNLLQVLNIDRRTQVRLKFEAFQIRTDIPAFETLYQKALENQPAYLNLLLSLQSAQESLILAKDSKRWALDAYVSYDTNHSGANYWNAQRDLTRFRDGGYQAGLTLIIPLDDKAAKREILGARVNLQNLELRLEEYKENLARDLEEQLRSLEVQRIQIELARREIDLRERQLFIENEKLKFSQNSENKKVVDAQDALTASQNSELDAKTRYWNSLNSLDTMLGITLDTWGINIEQVETYHDTHQFE